MRRIWTGGLLIVAASLPSAGCGHAATAPADNTVEVCRQVQGTITRYTTDAPEFVTVNASVQRGYKGTDDPADVRAAFAAYFRAYGKALRPLAEKATRPELKTALTKLADAYGRGDADSNALSTVLSLCPQPTSR